MKPIFRCVAFFFIFYFSILSQPVKAQNNKRKLEKEISRIEQRLNQLTKAMVDADSSSLDEICCNELSYGHSSSVVDNKADFIKKLTSGKSDFTAINIFSNEITIKGSTAIVRHVLDAKTNDNGQPGEVKLHVLLVWHKEKKKWKLLSRQAVKIAK